MATLRTHSAPAAAPRGLARVAGWLHRNRFAAHVVLPAAASTVLLALYFSGNPDLQALIVPRIEGLDGYSLREFGLLEMTQNAVLAALVAVAAIGFGRHRGVLRFAAAGLFAAAAFLLLEEIDYGRHLVDWFRGTSGPLAMEGWNRNLHNLETPSGRSVGSYLRLAANIATGLLFVIAPFVARRLRDKPLGPLVPSRWFVSTVLLSVLFSRIAHGLDDLGLATIAGRPGGLENNISEFRELNFYYLLLLYAVDSFGSRRTAPTGNR